jgi:hypothetical protein
MEIRKRKYRWIGHTLRKDDTQPSKVALQWNPRVNRVRGGGGDQETLEEIHFEKSWKKLE